MTETTAPAGEEGWFKRAAKTLPPIFGLYVAFESGQHIVEDWLGIPAEFPIFQESEVMAAALSAGVTLVFFGHWLYSVYESRRLLAGMLAALILVGPVYLGVQAWRAAPATVALPAADAYYVDLSDGQVKPAPTLRGGPETDTTVPPLQRQPQ